MKTRRDILKLTTIAGASLVAPSCAHLRDSSPTITAPKGMVPVIHGHMNSIYDCWKAKGVARVSRNKSDLRVRFVQATRSYKGIPTFVHEGREVGGVYFGNGCGKGGVIHLAAFGDKYSDAILKHEIAHHMDMQGPCFGGHPDVLDTGCLPHWPAIQATIKSTTTTDVSNNINRQIDRTQTDLHIWQEDRSGVVDVLVLNPQAEDIPSISLHKDLYSWMKSLEQRFYSGNHPDQVL